MRVAVFGTKGYDRRFLNEANAVHGHELVFLEPRLDLSTAPLAAGCGGVFIFVNESADSRVLETL
jgi:D-lactate dehydrogenase